MASNRSWNPATKTWEDRDADQHEDTSAIDKANMQDASGLGDVAAKSTPAPATDDDKEPPASSIMAHAAWVARRRKKAASATPAPAADQAAALRSGK